MFILQILLLCLISPSVEERQLGVGTTERLQTVVDGSDSLGEGFAALVEDVLVWDDTISAEHAQGLDWIMEDPSRARGRVFSLDGVAEQGNRLQEPWGGIEEWFIRNSKGALFCLYVVGESQLQQGVRLQVPARFYKTIEMEGRDKRFRMYPTFVTSSIVIPTLATSSEASLLFILLPIVALGSVVVFVLSRLGTNKKYQKQKLSIETEEVISAANANAGELPEDASQALAAMHQQSEGDR